MVIHTLCAMLSAARVLIVPACLSI
ncbi:hypothetical protein NC652_029068 [Populus alba x Populus x berolinensis]|nr:hypothetical protein NC652_029068 [Populus alba x Populus x berolinensis]